MHNGPKVLLAIDTDQHVSDIAQKQCDVELGLCPVPLQQQTIAAARAPLNGNVKIFDDFLELFLGYAHFPASRLLSIWFHNVNIMPSSLSSFSLHASEDFSCCVSIG